MNMFKQALFLACIATVAAGCSDNDEDVIITPPVSAGSKLTLEGGTGGASAVNMVFVDFSEDKQTSAARAAWDLGFYGGSDDFRVIINHTTGAAAAITTKTDLAQVTAADTTALAASGALNLGQGSGTFDKIDPVDGNRSVYLGGTVIKQISATDADNKVFIVARGTSGAANRGWTKIRVLRNGSNYVLQYARINETTFRTVNVTKDANLNFTYVSFDSGASVAIEPGKTNWDIVWTLSTYKATPTIPYTFSDYVIHNFVGGVQAAEVLTSAVSYADFKETNLSALTFSSNRETIGGNWRITSGTPIGVKTDRFYVVKDAAGNIYKLKFVSFHSSDGGERGRPVIEYALVKKA